MRKKIGVVLLCSVAMFATSAARAQQDGARDYDIVAQDLGTAITQVALRSGRQIIVADDLVRNPVSYTHLTLPTKRIV